jgi:hypothetical protein
MTGTQSSKPKWKRMFNRYRFDSLEVETLFKRYVFNLHKPNLISALVLYIILSATLAILNFVFVSHVTVENIFYLSQCAICIILLVYMHTKFMKESHVAPLSYMVVFLSLCVSVVSLPVTFENRPSVEFTPASGVWQTALVMYLVYSLVPLKIYVPVTLGLILPIIHILVSTFMANLHPWLLWREVS